MRCPCCNGNYEEQDVILYRGLGGGPYYYCGYCKEGKINFFKWIYWNLIVEPFWTRRPL